MENLICKNAGKSYKEKTVLKNVNLELEPGKIYGLIGRNGAGKTTLLSLMSAQNPVSEGEIFLGNEPVWENEKALSNICFSREFTTNPTGVGNMKMKQYLKTASVFYPYWDDEMAEKLVKLFELDTNKVIINLSKGMMSMVTIITALANKAPYTFLDEPTAGLDVVARDLFYRLLVEEYTESGRTFVISTHIIDEASDVFEEVIFIHNKGIFLKENTGELLERAVHISGRKESVDKVTAGRKVFGEEEAGRSKGVTLLLEPGGQLEPGEDFTIQKPTLQQLFVAMCGKEAGLYDRE